MTKQTEALKMAIEFIERHVEADEYDWLIQACKEALAEAEKQEPYAWEINHLDATSPPPYIVKHNPFYKNDSNTKVTPLYTHPATWQSLSDDEIAIVIKTTFPVNVGVTNVDLKFARAIEQALKEKNHETKIP